MFLRSGDKFRFFGSMLDLSYVPVLMLHYKRSHNPSEGLLSPFAGPFRTFSTRVWQNARLNTVRRVMVCDLHFFSYNFITLLKGLCACT